MEDRNWVRVARHAVRVCGGGVGGVESQGKGGGLGGVAVGFLNGGNGVCSPQSRFWGISDGVFSPQSGFFVFFVPLCLSLILFGQKRIKLLSPFFGWPK